MADKIIKFKDAKKARGKSGARQGRHRDDAARELAKRIVAINKSFALVIVGSKALVLFDTTDAEHRALTEFWEVGTFRLWKEPDRVYDEEEERWIDIGKAWLKSPDRRQYRGVSFSPEGAPDGFYNLWRGFAVKPAKPYADPKDHIKHFATFDDHLLRNVSQRDPALARYLYAFYADIVQRPTKKPGVALILRGLKGSGKSKVSEVFGGLWGRHSKKISKPKHLTGQFNAHMVECMLLRAEEGFWAGDKEAEGALKDLITSDVHMVERKGVDAVELRNLIRLIVTSNADWVIPATFDERRYAVFDVGNENLKDAEFFIKLDAEMDHGGREHLLAYLMAFDLGTVNVGEPPATQALLEQKFVSMDDVHNWWFDKLERGRVFRSHRGWVREVSSDSLYDNYLKYAEKISKARRLSKIQLGLALRSMLPINEKPQKGVPNDKALYKGKVSITIRHLDGSTSNEWMNGYRFPVLEICRDHFVKKIGHTIDWDGAPDDGRVQGETGTVGGDAQSATGAERVLSAGEGGDDEIDDLTD